MAAYKQFNSQDIIISPLEINKGFSFIGGNALTASNVGIDRFTGINGNYLTNQTLTGNIEDEKFAKVLVYNSIKQLYYTNYLSGSNGQISNGTTASFNTDGTITGPVYQTSYYNYEQTTLNPRKSFPTSSIGVISIPSKLFGDYIQPNSFLLEGVSGSIKDDGEGRLLWKHPNEPVTGYEYMEGNIIYQHGIITLFNSFTTGRTVSSTYGNAVYGADLYGGDEISREDFIDAFITGSNVTCSFSSSYKIFETQYKCTIGESEFNYSSNPTILSGSEGFVYDQYTSSYFDPYVTTVGMYNEQFELLAVGKLAQPLPTSRTTDTTILVNIDK